MNLMYFFDGYPDYEKYCYIHFNSNETRPGEFARTQIQWVGVTKVGNIKRSPDLINRVILEIFSSVKGISESMLELQQLDSFNSGLFLVYWYNFTAWNDLEP